MQQTVTTINNTLHSKHGSGTRQWHCRSNLIEKCEIADYPECVDACNVSNSELFIYLIFTQQSRLLNDYILISTSEIDPSIIVIYGKPSQWKFTSTLHYFIMFSDVTEIFSPPI